MFNFFKKKGSRISEEVELEKVCFSEVGGWISGKISENKKKEAFVLVEIRERIVGFGVEIKEKIIVLEEFDVDSKREDGRLKNAVVEARKIYVKFLRVLVRDLKKVGFSGLKLFVHEVNGILNEFSKKSFKNYERTTFLIGDEMAAIKNSLRGFSGDVLRIFDNNKDVVDSLNRLHSIKEDMDLLVSRDEVLSGIDKAISGFDNEIDNRKKERADLNRELEEFRAGSEYSAYLKDREEFEFLKKGLRGDVLSLKQVVDFKGLANFFHSDSRKMNAIKRYKDYFVENFEKDGGAELVDILEKADMGSYLVLGKIEGIGKKAGRVLKMRESLGKDESSVIMSRIDEVDLEIGRLGESRASEEKLIERLRENRDELFGDFKGEIAGLGVSVIS